ncbi:MAG: methyltransferase [Spirochaetaceae bacterium]|nr:methyltransferase [Spirochaetaceae bacterium]
MKFKLSLGLFSSNDIDSGSKVLLKSIAQQIPAENIKSVLDIGCGTGVIGISLKMANPDAMVTMCDRDALAVAFSKENAKLNSAGHMVIENKLAMEGLENEQYDLLISNIPAKAGETVLQDFFKRSVNFISPEGRVAVVIVTPLAAFAERTIRQFGHELLHKEETHNYSVFHFQGKKCENPTDDMAVYVRNHGDFYLKKTSYTLDTAYNIPDFDQPGFRITHAAEILDPFQIRGTGLFWYPGQGHIPVYSAVKRSNTFSKVILSGRDLLQIKMTNRNLKKALPELETVELPLYTESQLSENIESESLDFAAFDIYPISGTDWQKDLKEAAKKILKPGGWFFVIGKSADIHKVLKETRGFTPFVDKKYKGLRAALFQKNK